MPKLSTPLTFAKIKGLKPKEKLYKISDGGGLSLWVYPSGAMKWALSYRLSGKQQTIYLGNYPAYSLTNAREWREEIRAKLDRGLSIHNETNRDRYIFSHIYDEWFKRWSPERKNEKYVVQVDNAIKKNIFPILANMDIREIKAIHIVESLRPFEDRGALEYLVKIKSSLNLIFSFATSSGLIEANPVAAVGTQAFKKHKKSHHEALAPEQLPQLIEALENGVITDTTRFAIYWQLLTATRPIEAVSAKWEDIDLEARTWSIPAEIMKKSRPHIVPLSNMAMRLLEQIKQDNKKGIYLFESNDYKSHLNRETPRIMLRRAKLPTTAHGLRSLAGTILEEGGYSRELIHAVLAHAKDGGDQTTIAYMRSSLFEERKAPMEYLGNKIAELLKVEF